MKCYAVPANKPWRRSFVTLPWAGAESALWGLTVADGDGWDEADGWA